VAATIFSALFPVFALIGLGYVCGRRRWLGEEGDCVLTAFVAMIALPVLTFHVIATMNPADLFEPVMFTVVVGASYLVFALHFLLERLRGLDPVRANLAALGAAYGNSAFVGLPICLALFGPASLGPSAVVMALNTLFVFGGGAFASALAAARTGTAPISPSSTARLIFLNPLILGAAGGAVMALSGGVLPGPLDGLLRLLGGATAPCALVAIGMFVARPVPASGGTGATWRSLAGKLVLMPVVTAGLLALLPPLPKVWHDTALVMAAVPCASSLFVLARDGGEGALRLASRLIIFSMAAAAVTLPLLLVALQPGG
jgi:predicted permease